MSEEEILAEAASVGFGGSGVTLYRNGVGTMLERFPRPPEYMWQRRAMLDTLIYSRMHNPDVPWTYLVGGDGGAVLSFKGSTAASACGHANPRKGMLSRFWDFLTGE